MLAKPSKIHKSKTRLKLPAISKKRSRNELFPIVVIQAIHAIRRTKPTD